MWLQTRMYLLVAVLLGILYGVITGLGTWMGAGSAVFYIILAFVFLGIQYLIGPSIVGWTMKIKWVSEEEAPELHQMVAELAKEARLCKPNSRAQYKWHATRCPFPTSLRLGSFSWQTGNT